MSRTFYRNRDSLGAIPQERKTNQTISLLHMNGDNDSTVFTDETGIAWTNSGLAVLKTTAPKFGTACGYFAGNSQITADLGTAWDLGWSDYTIDFWFKCGTPGGVVVPIGIGDTVRFFFNNSSSSYVSFYIFNLAINNWAYLYPNTDAAFATKYFNNAWHHVAAVKLDTTIKLYIDGVAQTNTITATYPMADRLAYSGTPKVNIGGLYSGANRYTGYLDEVRFTKMAWYQGDFTPLSAEY